MITYTYNRQTYPLVSEFTSELTGIRWLALDATLPNRPKSIIWRRASECQLVLTVQLTPELNAHVRDSISVQIEVVKPVTALTVWKPACEWRLKPARVDYLFTESMVAA
jgi:hypothetical protein